MPATAGVTAGEVCCSFDGNGSSGLLCCDGPKGTVVLLSTSRPAFAGTGVAIFKTRMNGKFSIHWLVGHSVAYIQSGTSPASCFLGRTPHDIQQGNSLHFTIRLDLCTRNTKRTNSIDSLQHLRAIIPIGSDDGRMAKQNPASAPCKSASTLDDQLEV